MTQQPTSCPFSQTAPYTTVRRRDRAVDDDAWIRGFLERTPTGVLAMTRDAQPYVNSNIFVYDPESHSLFFHTAKKGWTRETVLANPRVCFTAHSMGRLLPAEEAVHFSVEYAGVVAFGRAEVVDEPAEATRGLDLLMRKYAPHLEPGTDYRGVGGRDLNRTTVLRMEVSAWSAKKKEAEAGFPGAYHFKPPL